MGMDNRKKETPNHKMDDDGRMLRLRMKANTKLRKLIPKIDKNNLKNMLIIESLLLNDTS